MGPTECGVFEDDHEASIMRSPWPIRGCWAMRKRPLLGLFLGLFNAVLSLQKFRRSEMQRIGEWVRVWKVFIVVSWKVTL